MFLAKESVATIITADKARDFKEFLNEAGVNVKFDPESVTPQDYQNLLASLKDSPIYSIVNRVMLRSMMKAVYSPENLGHFGLASECYCHFTSPIRRYPDLCIHRIIKESLTSPDTVKEKYKNAVAEASAQSSACERNAQEAERDVDNFVRHFCRIEKYGRRDDSRRNVAR